MRRRDALLALPALGALAACATARRAASAMNTAAIDAELRAIVEDPDAPLASLQALAIRSGRVVYEGAFGRRHIADGDAPDLPAQRDSLYRVASISKLVVTLGVLRLVEAGKLDLDADAGNYLGYPLRNPHYPEVPITLRMMAAHTSSIVDDGGYFFDESIDLRDAMNPAMWAKTRPGAYFRYTNFTWGIIGTIVEKVTGERFDLYMNRAVLRPLGMQGSFDAAAVPVERVATLYRKRKPDDDDGPWDPNGPWIAQVDDYHGTPPQPRTTSAYVVGRNGTRYGPQGGLRASAMDLGRAMRMLMQRGELDGQRFLQPSIRCSRATGPTPAHRRASRTKTFPARVSSPGDSATSISPTWAAPVKAIASSRAAASRAWGTWAMPGGCAAPSSSTVNRATASSSSLAAQASTR
jgi:CubicO group peptidase (beta-lactamase class C family)